MEPTDETPPETVHEYFVAQLRRLRQDRGLSQAQLARHLNYSPGLIGMVETRQRPPTADFAEACDREFATGGTLAALVPLIAREAYPSWFRSYVALEAEAVAIDEFEVQVVPGLLQTEGYARAVFSPDWPPRSHKELEQRLAARLTRQALLEREQPPLLWFILDESVLRRPVGSTADMAEQLDRLVSLTDRTHIKIQILPLTRAGRAPLDGSFVLLYLRDGEQLAYLEGPGGGTILPGHETRDRCARSFDVMRAEALSQAESATLISRVREELYGQG